MELRNINNLLEQVIKSILETIEILDDNYGANRNVDNDLGSYVLIAGNIVDIEILKCKL